jgi:hypothetical protein
MKFAIMAYDIGLLSGSWGRLSLAGVRRFCHHLYQELLRSCRDIIDKWTVDLVEATLCWVLAYLVICQWLCKDRPLPFFLPIFRA